MARQSDGVREKVATKETMIDRSVHDFDGTGCVVPFVGHGVTVASTPECACDRASGRRSVLAGLRLPKGRRLEGVVMSAQ